MATLTKAQTAKHTKLRAAVSATQDAVFACGPDNQTRFNDCLTLATPETRLAYEDAVSALAAFERAMVDERRAYIAQFGMFSPYLS